jgi:aryl-alcohol dehydrogenase-like predicted oxidoreductase
MAAADVIFGGIHIGPPDAARSGGAWGCTGTQAEADAVVRAAVAAGITDFDTAPMYASGSAEARLGAALAALGPDASGVRVTTKTGRLVRCPAAAPARPRHRPPSCNTRTPGRRFGRRTGGRPGPS